MSDDVQATEKLLEPSKARNSPKHLKSDWEAMRRQYEANDYKSLVELGHSYGICWKTMETRMRKEKWKDRKEALLSKVQAKIEEKSVDRVSDYLSKSFSTALKYERMIEVSQEHSGSKAPDGTPILDPEAIDQYSRSTMRIHELAKSALRLPAVQAVDITSQGKSIGASIIEAIEKLRESGKASDIKISDAAIDRVIEAEIVP